MVVHNVQHGLESQRATEVYELIWGNSNHPIIKHEPGIPYLDPQLSFFDPSPGIIMIRAEYDDMWDYVNRQRVSHTLGASRGMAIFGQPGIGKSCFLRYAYAKALQCGISVVYCRAVNRYWLADENGCREVYLNSIPPPPYPAEGTLVLVDSGANMEEPPELFTNPSCQGFVVQATAAGARQRGWMKERLASAWVMSPWTRDEIGALQRLYELKGEARWKWESWYTPLELFDLFGPSAEICFDIGYQKAKTTDGPVRDFARPISCEDLFIRPQSFIAAVMSAPWSAQTPDKFHLFFVGTSKYENPIDYPCLEYRIPTPFLRLALAKHFHNLYEIQRERLFACFSPEVEASWALYEPLVFDLLLETEEGLECKLGADGASFRFDHRLTLHPDVLDMDDPHFTPIDNRLYVLSGGYPALDALVVTEDKRRVTLLQISISGPHELQLAAVQQAMKLFGTAAAGIQWSLLFVTPSDRGRTIAASHRWEVTVARGQSSSKEKEATDATAPSYMVPLGWLRIDDGVHSVLEALTEIAGREKELVSTTIVPLPQDREVDGEPVHKKPRIA